MGKFMPAFFGLLIGYACIACAVVDKPTRSQARASTPTVTRVSTPTPAPETTATAAATPVVSATPSGPETIHETYIVQPGDTLNRIAARFSQEPGHNVTVAAIVAANGISNPALIGVGQQFTIPVVVTDGTAAPPTATPAPSPTSVSKQVVVKHLFTYTKAGTMWRNIVIQPGLSRDTLGNLARELRRMDRTSSWRLFDDGAQFKQFRDWDVNYPNPRYPFPETWVNNHLVGTVQDMTSFGNTPAGWGLYSPHAERLLSLP